MKKGGTRTALVKLFTVIGQLGDPNVMTLFLKASMRYCDVLRTDNYEQFADKFSESRVPFI